MTINKLTPQQLVAKFMVTCEQWNGVDVLSTPKPKDQAELETYKLRLKLCIEETFELFEAMLTEEAYRPFDLLLATINLGIENITLNQLHIDPVAVFDSLVDQEYVNLGFANLLSLDMQSGFQEVHKSNMTKLDENGQPIFRKDGKLLKSNLYVPPNLDKVYKETVDTFNKESYVEQRRTTSN